MERTKRNCPRCGREIYFEGLCYDCRQREKREAYQSLPESEIAAKVEASIAAMGADFYKKDESYDFLNLLAYRGVSTERIAEAAANAGVYYPCELYRDAAPAVREKLIALLMEPDCAEANHILQCLAIAGGADVLTAFRELEKNPRKWAKKLHVPPSVYAWAGGWTFGESGERIELNYDACFHVAPASGEASADAAVSVAAPREDTCPHCGSRLIDILTIDGGDARLAFLEIGGILRIPVCPQCAAMCERTVVRYTLDGDGAPELVEPFADEGEEIDDGEYAEMTSGKFALTERPAPLFFARGCDDSAIVIGGFAAWIQDFQYDACPDCGRTMRYLASVPWTALSDYSEGTLFLEICPDCQIAGAFHQQT